MVHAYNNLDKTNVLKPKVLPESESHLSCHSSRTSLRHFNLSRGFNF